MKQDLTIELFGDRLICIGGIGKMFDQEGFPIQMAIEILSKENIEVSMFHVADELLKLGWKCKTIESKLCEDYEGNIPIELLKQFIYATYEDQREMILEYLFKSNRELATNFALTQFVKQP
jgi:hypothetical protein